MRYLVPPFILGIFAADFFIDRLAWNTWLMMGVLVAFAVLLILFNKEATRRTFTVASYCFALFLGFSLFLLRYTQRRYAEVVGQQEVTGVVIAQPEKKPNSWAVRLRTEGGDKVLIYTKDSTLIQGDSITLYIYKGMQPTCPLDSEDSTFAFYQKYLFYSGIVATGYSEGVQRVQGVQGVQEVQEVQRVQELVTGYGEASSVSLIGDEEAVLLAMTLGQKQHLSKQLRQKYARAGVSHVLALSGFHLTIIYGMLQFLLLGKVILYRWRWTISIVIFILLWTFAWITGFSPSLVRAAIMVSIVIGFESIRDSRGSRSSRSSGGSLNSLAIAAMAMLLYNPFWLLDVGFQLSFVSMLGILLVGVPYCDKLAGLSHSKYWQWAQKVLGIVVITIVCSIFTAPLCAFYFGQIPVLGILSNLAITLLATLILMISAVGGLTCLVCGSLGIVSDVLIWLASQMNVVVGWVASLDFAVIEWRPNLLGVMLSYVVLTCVLLMLGLRRSTR